VRGGLTVLAAPERASDPGAGAAFYTVSDARFFVGTVALLNSLRLTGHEQPLVVLDQGLELAQLERLGLHATVVAFASEREHPVTAKPFPYLADGPPTVVVIDSDMIVTGPLGDVLAEAGEGRICLFPDHVSDRGRWFAEWKEIFELAGEPRRQTYLNSGFVALSSERWPALLPRWWDACSRIPGAQIFTSDNSPLRDGDQDALNAILMSEIPEASVLVLDDSAEAYPDALTRVVVQDERSLACTIDGDGVVILHHAMRPKVWLPSGRRRVDRRDAYLRLLPRLLFDADVALRLSAGEVPVWLRPSPQGRAALSVTSTSNRARERAARVVSVGRRRARKLAGLARG
jgi:hypothetical protein